MPVHADVASSGPGPVHLQQPEVGERIAERADLPVEHGDHVAVVVDHAVVEAVVAVHDRGRALLGDAARAARRARGRPPGSSRVLPLVPLAVPALQLAGDVALVAAERRRGRRRRDRPRGWRPSCRRCDSLARAAGRRR